MVLELLDGNGLGFGEWEQALPKLDILSA